MFRTKQINFTIETDEAENINIETSKKKWETK